MLFSVHLLILFFLTTNFADASLEICLPDVNSFYVNGICYTLIQGGNDLVGSITSCNGIYLSNLAVILSADVAQAVILKTDSLNGNTGGPYNFWIQTSNTYYSQINGTNTSDGQYTLIWTGNSSSTCVGLQSETSISNIFWIKDSDCQLNMWLVCEKATICPAGWILSATNQCYKFINTTYYTWQGAMDYCKSLNSSLPILRMESERDAYRDMTSKLNNEMPIYLGLIKVGTQWVWTDNTSANYLNWAPGEPNNYGPCTNMAGPTYNNTLNDIPCDMVAAQFYCQLYPSPPCEPGWLTSTTGQCYLQATNINNNVTSAFSYCQSVGSQLPIFHTEVEATSYRNLLLSLNITKSYIGLKSQSGVWTWIDNSSLTLTKWRNGEPSGDGTCVMTIDTYQNGVWDFLWNDISCTANIMAFFCQHEQTTTMMTTISPTVTTTEPMTTSYNQYYCTNGWLASTTGQCYMYFDNVASFFLWNAALTYCQAYNASLPIFRSMDEQIAYNNLMMSINVPDGPHQLGLYLDPGNEVEPPHWMWADNTVPTFFNWGIGSPSGGEDCSYMSGLSVNNEWNDYGCTWNLQPIAYCCQTNASIAVPPILKEMNISMDFLADPMSLTTTIQDIGPFLITSLNASMKEKLGQPYSDLVRICTYENKDCSDRANFQYLYNPNFGNCYTFNFEDKPKYFIKDVGPDYGLQILLSASQEDYSCASQNAGFRVTFHETNSTVYPESEGYNIPPGTASTITLEQSTMNRLGKPIYDCVDSDHSGRIYSVEGCLRRCFQNYVIQQCHCADPRFPTTPNDSICHYNKKSCLDYINTCTFDEAMAECDCPPPCREIVYYPTITSVNIHSTDVYKKSFCSNAVDIYKCESSFNDNFAILYVYYRSLKTFEFSEVRTYDLMRLLSDFSGVTGLLLGVCVMTIPEVALLLFSLATSCCTKRK